MRTKIDSHINYNGLSVKIEAFLEAWADYAGRSLKQLPFKRDLRYWNTGNTSMQPKKMVACMVSDGYDTECRGVYEIWQRQDGFGMEVYKFDTMEDYENYSPSQESPSAFAKEIGI